MIHKFSRESWLKIPRVLMGIIMMSTLTPSSAQDSNGDEVAMRALVVLEKQLQGATGPEAKKVVAARIIEIGQPLLDGGMSPDASAVVARALKDGAEPPPKHKGYFGFWLLRAMAAVMADQETAGTQAGQVIQILGKESKKEAVLNIQAALLAKGWLMALSPEGSTKSRPFSNSLGMRFVPVPITGGPTDGKKILFCAMEVRVKDFAAFVEETGYDAVGDAYTLQEDGTSKQAGGSWINPHFKQSDEHPVTCVNWNDAVAFCAWLARKEGLAYRLPRDHEWSCAAGIGELENAVASPKDKSGQVNGFPWGGDLPPSTVWANYAGSEARVGGWANDWSTIKGFRDGYLRTSPVGSFSANRYGLYDLYGNVWEWCEDWNDPKEKLHRVLRGASWRDSERYNLVSSRRGPGTPGNRYDCRGFRVVLAVGAGG